MEPFEFNSAMNVKRIHLLLVEDDEDDAVIFRRIIDSIRNWRIDIDWASTFEAAVDKTARNFHDLYMIDFQLGESSGLDLIRMMNQNGSNIPMIMLTGKADRSIDLAAMATGAADYLEKANLTPELLERTIRYSIERNRALTELRNARERLRKLSAKLIDAQERERRLIARELHDSIGSGMTAIQFALQSKLESMDTECPPSQGISVEQILAMVRETIEENRRISAKLRPSILDDLGLVQTIGWMCRNFGNIHPDIRLRQEIGIKESDVPESLKTVIYRILQEALNNVAKHSNADTVDLSVKRTERRLELEVRDNGRGFDMEELPSSMGPEAGMGLEGMQDRVEFTDGRFEIVSQKGKGTTVRAAWPIFPPIPFQ